MSNVWERFDSIVKPEEVTEAKSKFAPVEAGKYLAVLEEITPAENKDGLPMLKGKFRTVESNRILFYNQNLQNLNYPNMTAVNVAEAVTFISNLTGEDVEFTNLSSLATLVSTIQTGGEYMVEVYYGKTDLDMKFPKLKVARVEENAPLEEDDIAF